MTTPHAALLSVRKLEEQQAEAVLASALREVESLETLLRRLTEARAAWLAGALGGAAETFTGLETAERMAGTRVIDAQRRAMAAREALLESQRQRKVVEEPTTSASPTSPTLTAPEASLASADFLTLLLLTVGVGGGTLPSETDTGDQSADDREPESSAATTDARGITGITLSKGQPVVPVGSVTINLADVTTIGTPTN